MAKVKGTTLVMIRTLLQEAGSHVEEKFLGRLTPEDRDLFINLNPPNWVPVETAYRICLQAAPFLGCAGEHPILELIQKTSPRNFNTIYKAFFRVASISFIIKRAAAIWATVNDSGKAYIENSKPNQADFVVKEYPQMHTYIYEATCGHIMTLLKHTGAKNIKINHKNEFPNTVRWNVVWE